MSGTSGSIYRHLCIDVFAYWPIFLFGGLAVLTPIIKPLVRSSFSGGVEWLAAMLASAAILCLIAILAYFEVGVIGVPGMPK